MFVSQTMSPFDIIMHSTKWRLHAALFMLFILNVKQSGIEGLLKAPELTGIDARFNETKKEMGS